MSGISESNPFVGPRPLQQGETLYGRSREIRELYNRLQSRRIVVLHSPSGAGKSSLVQAGLIPRLREAHYDVWKPIRVNLDPRGLDGVPAGTNRYLLSALVSLEEELQPERRRSPAQLAGMDFLSYLNSRPRRKGRAAQPAVLLFDQFEEILTTAPRAVEEKKAFFREIGEALNAEHYWALFIIREDYLAAFAPYREYIPTHMSTTFRLDLLDLEGAKEVAEQLARKGGRSFPAVDKLIRDLSRVQVQQPDGSFVAEQGIHVEPVHLQVVGRRLWAAMPDDDLSIDEADVAKYAEVSKALAGYYSEAVKKIAGGDLAVERALREWVGERLIVGGVRSQVRQEATRSAGLENTLIEQLLGSYLVRTEQRAGSNWFELGHDRMVEPVLEDNRAWEEEHLHPLQVQARLWEQARRAPSMLLSAEALPEAGRWAQQNPTLLTREEQEYLALSQKLRREEAEIRRRQRRYTTAVAAAAALATVAALVSLVLFGRAERASRQANDALRKSEYSKRAAAMSLVYLNQRERLNRSLQTQMDAAEREGNTKQVEVLRGYRRQWLDSTLTRGMYLKTNDYIRSPGLTHYAVQHDDGSFCTYKGTNPGEGGEHVWCSREGGPIGNYYSLFIPESGRFCTYEGSDPLQQGKEFWCAKMEITVSPEKSIFGRIDDDGQFRWFEGNPERAHQEIGSATGSPGSGPSNRNAAAETAFQQQTTFFELDEQTRLQMQAEDYSFQQQTEELDIPPEQPGQGAEEAGQGQPSGEVQPEVPPEGTPGGAPPADPAQPTEAPPQEPPPDPAAAPAPAPEPAPPAPPQEGVVPG